MPEDADSLRAEVARLRKAATRKISRLKVNHDVFVSGSSFDPRRAPKTEKKYTTSQLRSYKNDLAGFLDRGNQFVPDSQRRPMPRSDFQTYKRLEREFNESVNRYFDNVSQVKLPSGETVAERMSKMRPDHRQMGNVSVNAPYDPPNRDSINIAGASKLKDLIGDMRERLKPGYFERHNDDSKDQFRQMAEIINEPELSDSLKGLSDEQFAVLWNYTPFATAVSMLYEIQLKLLSDKEKPWHSDVQRNAVRESRALAKWAKSLKVGK